MSGRGKTGTVRGLSAQEVTDTLLDLLDALGDVHPDTRRRAAIEILLDRGYDEDTVTGLITAFLAAPGVRPHTGGMLFPADPEVYVRNREWRIALGRADLADAVGLRDALLQIPSAHLTPNLRKLRDRLDSATTPLFEDQ